MKIQQFIYDGSLIHDRFAYKFFKKKVSATGNIVSFVAPMYVTTNLIDLEDTLNNDYIYSSSAINFCWEIPNLCSFGAVAFQRLFAVNIGNILYSYIKKSVSVDGDDIMVTEGYTDIDGTVKNSKGKASVSITYSKDNVAIGHLGINIDAGNQAPSFAYSTRLTEEQQDMFIEDVQNLFYSMVNDIFVATSKVIV